MEVFIIMAGFFILGFMIGLAVGSIDQTRMIREAFKKEGYDYQKFNDVMHRINDR